MIEVRNREESVLDKNLEPMMTSVRMSCRCCRRSFGSQQSLECHVRIDHANQRSKNRSPSPAAGEVEEKPTCDVCGKSFGSEKSLNGHMRTHQERQCRGIKAPKNADSSSSSFSSSSLPSNWAVTGKRGRKSTSSRTTPEEGEENYEDKEAVQAAENLVWLSNSKQFHSPQIDDHDQEQKMIKEKMKGKRKLMELEEEDEKPMNKNMNQRKMQPQIPSTSGCNRHRCRICSKIFMSGQALGGHMSSHITRNKSSSSSQANCPCQTSNQTKKIAFRFDLNELPPMEEDEEEAVANDNVCSSSTHNNPQQQ